ncbi:MAG: RNA polymerase factor sigma-54 [Gemmataceae bacterium]
MSGGMSMGLGMRQSMNLSQHLAPRMIQSMEILQLPALALQERIEQEMLENPVLELRDTRAETDDRSSDDAAALSDGPEVEFNPDGVLKHDDTGDMEFARMDELNKDWDDHFDAETRPSRSMLDELSDRKLDAMQNIPMAEKSLKEHLGEQLSYQKLQSDELRLAAFVISYLDENGYLIRHDENRRPTPITVEQLVRDYEAMTREVVTLADMEDGIFIVQQLDPAGVGARDTRECLRLQVDADTPHADLIEELIENHLEDIAASRLAHIQRETGASSEVIREAIDILKHLDPRPGSKFATTNTQYVVADVVVERADDGTFTIRLTDDWTPTPRISKKYRDLAKDKSSDPKAREYLRKKITAASWLIDAIEQRRNTLIKVTREIVEHQRAFLDRGPDFIQPLKMDQIAEKVGVHVTTVSRAVDEKWVETPRGLFPLKRFFGGGTRNAQTGQDVAWESIKQKLQEIIAAEDKAKPLSDEDIVEKFQEAGLTVARRTVTKYREAMNIPSSRQRKEWARL